MVMLVMLRLMMMAMLVRCFSDLGPFRVKISRSLVNDMINIFIENIFGMSPLSVSSTQLCMCFPYVQVEPRAWWVLSMKMKKIVNKIF